MYADVASGWSGSIFAPVDQAWEGTPHQIAGGALSIYIVDELLSVQDLL